MQLVCTILCLKANTRYKMLQYNIIIHFNNTNNATTTTTTTAAAATNTNVFLKGNKN